MELVTNGPAYLALKRLAKGGHLLFDLGLVLRSSCCFTWLNGLSSALVHDLLKVWLLEVWNSDTSNCSIQMFGRSRSISSRATINLARKLFQDFPSEDHKVRHTMILTACFTNHGVHESSAAEIHRNILAMGLGTITFAELRTILLSPFIEKHHGVMLYAKAYVSRTPGDPKGLTKPHQRHLLCEVAVRCLEISSKGRFLRRLCNSHDHLYERISMAVLTKHRLDINDLPVDIDVATTRPPLVSAQLSHCPLDRSEHDIFALPASEAEQGESSYDSDEEVSDSSSDEDSVISMQATPDLVRFLYCSSTPTDHPLGSYSHGMLVPCD